MGIEVRQKNDEENENELKNTVKGKVVETEVRPKKNPTYIYN